MASQERWVIVGEIGLYTGQYLRRDDAIASHSRTRAKDRDLYDALPCRGPLTPEHKTLWRQCRRNGDRCVKARISWDD